MSAEEFMYVTGHDVAGDAQASSARPRRLDLPSTAMSAIEQPAARSGRITCWCGAGQDVGALGHEVHAAEDDELGVRPGGRLAGELERVAGDVGELDDLVALVVVAEHEDPVAERGLGARARADQVGVARRGQVAGALDAALEVKSLLEQEGREDLALRVAVQPGGCSGLRYQLFFDERALDGDVVKDFDGVKVVTDRMSAPYLGGASIDFVDTIEKQGFTIDNPNASGSCACGDSFS
jgi:iron-sulfur cluster assembly accessory protein